MRRQHGSRKFTYIQRALKIVSSEYYYQTIKALDIGKGGDFSLRILFKQNCDTFQKEEEEESIEAIAVAVLPN